MTPLLKPVKSKEETYMYHEGDVIERVYFLYDGIAGYVLPDHDNLVFGLISKGDFFGLIDLIPDQTAGGNP